MDAKLDNTDIAIVKALIQDGRKSFRQIAREIKVSTPTVEARIRRLKGLRIIKNIQPIFDIEKIDGQSVCSGLCKDKPFINRHCKQADFYCPREVFTSEGEVQIS